MGIIVDLTPRLTLARRLRELLKELQFSSLRNAHRYLDALEQEIGRQEAIICDRASSYEQIEDAIQALDLLGELSRQRKRDLAELERILAGGGRFE